MLTVSTEPLPCPPRVSARAGSCASGADRSPRPPASPSPLRAHARPLTQRSLTLSRRCDQHPGLFISTRGGDPTAAAAMRGLPHAARTRPVLLPHTHRSTLRSASPWPHRPSPHPRCPLPVRSVSARCSSRTPSAPSSSSSPPLPPRAAPTSRARSSPPARCSTAASRAGSRTSTPRATTSTPCTPPAGSSRRAPTRAATHLRCTSFAHISPACPVRTLRMRLRAHAAHTRRGIAPDVPVARQVPTLAGALHLFLVRFLTGNFKAAFDLAPACVSDERLSPEEEQARGWSEGAERPAFFASPCAEHASTRLLLTRGRISLSVDHPSNESNSSSAGSG